MDKAVELTPVGFTCGVGEAGSGVVAASPEGVVAGVWLKPIPLGMRSDRITKR
jgi:hypothetical protein